MSEICVTSTCEPLPLAPFRPSRSSLLDALLRNFAASDRILVLTIGAPWVDPAALLQLEPGDGFVYLPPSGPQFAGLGKIRSLEARGPQRFASLLAQAEALRPRFETLNFAEGRFENVEGRPLFFGGLAFAPGGADAGPWAAFGDASFVLPRWLYRRQGSSATLSLTLDASDLRQARQRRAWLAALEARVEALARSRRSGSGRGVRLRVSFPKEEEVERRIRAIAAAIASGQLAKVVTALRFSAEILEPCDLLHTFRRLGLAAAGSETTPFLFRRGGVTFLGATPELLVARAGTSLRSEALAGSWRHDLPLIDFLNSHKNGHEHQIVVEAIRQALEPLCGKLTVAPQELRHLRRLSHLFTRIEGQLTQPLHLLAIAERLHPTPAVGGWPQKPALELLAELEAEPRGWYAGPVGYFDSHGDGELRVALRSAIVSGSQAWVYAGAGIVAGSLAQDELAEMTSKARAMLDALGGVRSFEGASLEGPQPASPVHASFTTPPQAKTHGSRTPSGRSRAA